MTSQESGSVPRDDDALCYLTASLALQGFAGGSVSPVEVLDSIAERIEQLEPQVNAFTELMLEDAYVQARASADRWATGSARPLEGLVVAVKEEQPIAGRTLEEGSLAQRGQRAQVTHPVIERLLDAGAVIVGRTTTPEFSCAFFTHSRLWGITRNPMNLEYSPGGSSGGSAAALAAGMATAATGSDIAGSIRVPASSCGVVGLKPAYGRVPALPAFNLDTYCHDGPLARSAADVELLMQVMGGADLRDQASVQPDAASAASLRHGSHLRIAVCVRLGDYPVDDRVRRAVLDAARHLEELGAVVEEVELPWSWELVAQTAWIHYGHVFAASMGAIVDEHPDDVMPYTKRFVERGREAAERFSYYDGLVDEAQLYEPLGRLFGEHDVLLCPTIGHVGLKAGEDRLDHGVLIGDREYDPWDVAMTVPFNIASRCPALSAPVGFGANGVPIGVQVVGRPYDESTVLEVGRMLETVDR